MEFRRVLFRSQIVPFSPASVREYHRASVQTIGLAVAMKLTTNAPDALAEAHRPWAAVIGVKRMIRTMIDGGFQAHAGVGADAAAVAGRDQRNLGAGAASLAVGILEAAPLLAIVRDVGMEIGPDEGETGRESGRGRVW